MIKHSSILLITFCFSLNVHSRNTDEFLYESCLIAKKVVLGNKLTTEESDKAVRYGYCIGVLQSVMDINLFLSTKNDNETLFCQPNERITNDELVKIFIHYVDQNPEQAKLPEVETVLNSYKDIFQCKK